MAATPIHGEYGDENKTDPSTERIALQLVGKGNDKNQEAQEKDTSSPDMLEKRFSSADIRRSVLIGYLYVLQQIPVGLAFSVPIIAQRYGATYSQQTLLSTIGWPYSMKLLWAPFIDSWSFPTMSPHKSWLLLTQYLLGSSMLVMGVTGNSWLLFSPTQHFNSSLANSNSLTAALKTGSAPSDSPHLDVYLLTAAFFWLCLLAATQDVAVDGWAIRLLSKRNVGVAATCQCIGGNFGWALGYNLFLLLESPNFCNRYLRWEPQPEGILSLPRALTAAGLLYIISTSVIGIFKQDSTLSSSSPPKHSALATYKQLGRLFLLPNVRLLAFLLLTAFIGFSVFEAVTNLKLVEYGMTTDSIALLMLPVVPLRMLLSLVLVSALTGPRPTDVFLYCYPFRLVLGGVTAVIVWQISHLHGVSLYGLLFISMASYELFAVSMGISMSAFFNRLSDPTLAGTYMTLLNTLSNLGNAWSQTLAVGMVDVFTTKSCYSVETQGGHKQECVTIRDGYYIEVWLCVTIGFIWIAMARRKIRSLQDSDIKNWRNSGYVEFS